MNLQKRRWLHLSSYSCEGSRWTSQQWLCHSTEVRVVWVVGKAWTMENTKGGWPRGSHWGGQGLSHFQVTDFLRPSTEGGQAPPALPALPTGLVPFQSLPGTVLLILVAASGVCHKGPACHLCVRSQFRELKLAEFSGFRKKWTGSFLFTNGAWGSSALLFAWLLQPRAIRATTDQLQSLIIRA